MKDLSPLTVSRLIRLKETLLELDHSTILTHTRLADLFSQTGFDVNTARRYLASFFRHRATKGSVTPKEFVSTLAEFPPCTLYPPCTLTFDVQHLLDLARSVAVEMRSQAWLERSLAACGMK